MHIGSIVLNILFACSASLKTYAHDDISVGSWMMGVQATYKDDNRFCCSSINQGELASMISPFDFYLLLVDHYEWKLYMCLKDK